MPISAPIRQLASYGQSLWLDNLSRDLLGSGELERLRDIGVSGITSNPTIFEKAIRGSDHYHAEIANLANSGIEPEQILWDLMVEDVQAAADVFRPLYESTGGADGFVSIEVGPAIASDSERTLAMARELTRRAGRANVMVKIPATPAGLPAIRRMVAEGRNVNVTLIFSIERYVEVVDAYLSGLEDLHNSGGNLHQVSSVASFFVSRVDASVDALLAERIRATTNPDARRELDRLYGKAGIANSKLAYQQFRALFSGPRWQALERAGARLQRCLWASTSVKSARYPDTMYVDGLIGPDTVNTVPNATLVAFLERGRIRRTLDEDIDIARDDLQSLAEAGIQMAQVTRALEEQGIQAFVKSYESLLEVIAESQPVGAGRSF
jgi:transaldolase